MPAQVAQKLENRPCMLPKARPLRDVRAVMTATPDIPGERFVLMDRLGEGGNAMVWRAMDREMRRVVAIKILRSPDPDLRARFAQETDVLANLQHANVIQAVARGVTGDGAPFVGLELIAGQSLRARLDADGPLPWRGVVAIGVALAGALVYLHAQGVIHRDIKPENVMLAPDGCGGHVVKLIDFGVARLTDDWEPAAGFTPTPPLRRTAAGAAVGTPGYMPPEAGYEPPDERFDVFGLAVTLHELCSGERAGARRSLPTGIPADLGTVLAAALAVDAEDRTQTAAEFGRALEAVLTAHPEPTSSTLLDGRYERIAVIGTGGLGDVFHACHRGSGHDVALKFLRSTAPDDVRRFAREATLLSQLDHPCIPRFFDYAPQSVPPYIAMARATGVPAARLCPPETQSRLTPVEVAQVGLQLAEALDHLHACGVLHRDVNANNVIIDLQREPRATLIDLGCATLTDAYYSISAARYRTPPERRVDIPDGGIETLPWAAPEARAGHGFIDRSDVYSLGFLLYRLLTGKKPVLRDDGTPVSPRTHNPRCPQDIAVVVVAALHPDPRSRPTAAQLAVRFRDVLTAEEELDETAPEPAPASTAASTRGWTRFTAVTAEPAPPEPDVPQLTPANVLPFHPRDILERATSTDAAFAAEVRRPKRRVWAAAAALVGFGVLVGVAAREATSESDAVMLTMRPSVPEAQSIEVPAASAPTPAMPALPRLDEVLQRINEPLRRCSKLDGNLLLVEFEVADGLARFAQASPVGETSAAARRCIDAALAQVQFTPAPAETFTLEYMP